MIVLSPSNMSTYRSCPLRFCGQSVTKDIKWKASEQKSRGSVVHNNVQKCLKEGWIDTLPWDSKIDMGYTRDVVRSVRGCMADGWELHIEYPMCVTSKGESTDWWGDDAALRARADAVLMPPPNSDKGVPLVVDIKTGKKWDSDDFQLRLECLLIHVLFKEPVVKYEYWYVDQGETSDGIIDFRNGLTPVKDIIDLMADMRKAMASGHYPATPNKFCRWCDYYKTEKCK